MYFERGKEKFPKQEIDAWDSFWNVHKCTLSWCSDLKLNINFVAVQVLGYHYIRGCSQIMSYHEGFMSVWWRTSTLSRILITRRRKSQNPPKFQPQRFFLAFLDCLTNANSPPTWRKVKVVLFNFLNVFVLLFMIVWKAKSPASPPFNPRCVKSSSDTLAITPIIYLELLAGERFPEGK